MEEEDEEGGEEKQQLTEGLQSDKVITLDQIMVDEQDQEAAEADEDDKYHDIFV